MNSNNLVANARTSGARLVCRTVFASSSSSAFESGRARDASIAAGVAASPATTVFLCLAAGSEAASSGSLSLFLVTFLAALRICFATFPSPNIAWIAVMDDFARMSELTRRLDHLEFGLDLERVLPPGKLCAL